MSMPSIPDITPKIELDREESLNLLLASIAMEEMGLAHILNTEGEKLQHILADKNVCIHDVLTVNDSIDQVIKSVTKLQLILHEKLELVTRLIKKSEPCPSPHPQPPKPKCVLLGYAAASVQNKEDRFHNATAIIDAKDPHKEISGYYPLTYSLFKGQGC